MKRPPSTSSLLLLLLILRPDPGTALLLPPGTTCCTELYKKALSNKLLRKVIRVELQEADGDCHLRALVLHLDERSVCIHPQNRSLIHWFQHQGRRRRGAFPNLNFGQLRKMGWGPQQPK